MFKDRPVVLLAIGQTLAWAGIYYVFPALLLRWEQALGWSKSDLTAAISLAVLISAIVSPYAGKIIDSGRGPLLMSGSCLCGGVGLMLLSLVTALWEFYAIWVVLGLAMAGCLYEPCFALVTRSKGKNAKHSIIFITLAAGFASTISFPVVHTLTEAFGWRSTVVLFGAVIILVVAPMLWRGAHELEKSRGKHIAAPSAHSERHINFLKLPVFWFLAFGFAFAALAHGATLHHLLPILDDRGLASEMAVLAASFIGPMQVAGRLAMMASEKYVSLHSVTIVAFGTIGTSLVMLLFSGSSPVFLSAFVILFGGAYGTVSILRPVIARDMLGEHNFGAKSGALAFLYLVGSASSPYLGSILWNLGGYNTMLGILMACTITACILYVIAHRLAQRTPFET